MLIGCARVSCLTQNLDRHIAALLAFGCDKFFGELVFDVCLGNAPYEMRVPGHQSKAAGTNCLNWLRITDRAPIARRPRTPSRSALLRLEPCHSLTRLGGGGEDGFGIILQELQPIGNVLRVVRAGVLSDAGFGTEHRGTDFGDEFFGGIGFLTKATGEIAIAARFLCGPMG